MSRLLGNPLYGYCAKKSLQRQSLGYRLSLNMTLRSKRISVPIPQSRQSRSLQKRANRISIPPISRSQNPKPKLISRFACESASHVFFQRSICLPSAPQMQSSPRGLRLDLPLTISPSQLPGDCSNAMKVFSLAPDMPST